MSKKMIEKDKTSARVNRMDTPKNKLAVIVSTTDSYANGVKPNELRKHLEFRGFQVELLPGAHELRLGKGLISSRIPIIKPFDSFLVVAICYILVKLLPWRSVKVHLRSIIRYRLTLSHGLVTHERLARVKPGLVICESNYDIGFVQHGRVADVQLLDLPAPGAEEIYFGGQLTHGYYEKLKKYEVLSYGKADALSFHWHTYTDYVKKNKYNGPNIIDMGYGTDIKELKATYSDEPRIIFLGYLKGYWVNIKLLEEIASLCPNLHVYGGPKPEEGSKINYKGYAPSLDVMAEYQFGLTTITDDDLRKNSFSSKHLEYVSYGLPVLTPSWRKDALLDDSSIYYSDASDLVSKLREYTDRKKWDTKHRFALEAAEKFTWTEAFKPLDSLLVEFKLIKDQNL